MEEDRKRKSLGRSKRYKEIIKGYSREEIYIHILKGSTP